MMRATALAMTIPFMDACTVDEDCELNGVCVDGAGCSCDPGWTGDTCGMLDLVPAPSGAGLRQEDWSTWCGTVAQDPESGEFNMFSSEMGDHGSLSVWKDHSQIIRATSTSAVGPYTPVKNSTGGQEVVVHQQAHNPMLIQAPDGTYLLYDSYAGEGFRCVDAGPGVFYYHTSPSLQGPWTLRTMNITYACKSCNLTPTPAFHPNGTFFLMFHCDDDAGHSKCDLTMHRGDSWEGPLEAVNSRVWDQAQAPGHTEDPFLWIDARGHWHVLLHNGAHGVHLHSRDGLDFTVAKGNQAPWPFTTDISTSDGAFEVHRRERPWMLFEDGSPRLFVSSVQPKEGRTFTHVQEVAAAKMELL